MLKNFVNSAQLWFECCTASCFAEKSLSEFTAVLVLTGLLRNVSGEFNSVSTCDSVALFVHEDHIEFCTFTPKKIIASAINLRPLISILLAPDVLFETWLRIIVLLTVLLSIILVINQLNARNRVL